ncbi:MAG: AI-2E family transporter [Candidatus Cloacimonadota bacterium]|nr:AI-2E family transporter [Candidatus Cloacimonadota bacterium]
MNNNSFLKMTLGLISLTIIVIILKELKAIFIPLTLAILLSFLFAPLNRFLVRKKVPTAIILAIMIFIILTVFTLIGSVIYASISSFVMEFPKYEAKITNVIQNLIIELEIPQEEITNYLSNKVNWVEIADRLSLSDVLSKTTGSFINFLINLLLIVVFMIFIVLGRNKMFKRMEKIITHEKVMNSVLIFSKLEKQLKTYLLNKTFISILTAVFGMFFIYIFGVDFVIISGFFLFVLNFIPNIGSIIATLFPIVVCMIQYGFSWQLIALSSSLILTQATMANVIEPNLMGTRLNLSPIMILIALIFWYWVWGPVGMILAIPLTSAFSIIIKEFDSMKVISALISDD